MANDLTNLPWIEKYRPRKIDEITQNKELLDLFRTCVETKNIPHMLLYGASGCGKTSSILAVGREIFKEHFRTRIIEFNASDDRGINAVRENITNEAKKYVSELVSEDGTKIPPYKIIILDEADSMTDEAQDALRVIIEQYSKVTRFCFICNYISKMTDAIKSRCSLVYFKKLNNECMVEKLNEIAVKESMVLEKNIINTIIDVSNGDMRKAIMMLQNLKYLYLYKTRLNKNLSDMTIEELKYTNITSIAKQTESEITEKDIYNIAASIDLKQAHQIISNVLACKKILEITILSKNIISYGFPIDNLLSQLNRAVMESDKLEETEKAKIIKYSGNILLKMKESGNEYIQLLNYLSSIYGVKKGIAIYD